MHGEIGSRDYLTMHINVMSVSSCLLINKLILLSCIPTSRLWTAVVKFSDPRDFEQEI